MPCADIEDELAISIHAPSRERLNASSTLAASSFDFNPRSLAGATKNGCKLNITVRFQSTLPRGSDAGYNLFRSPTLEFQSTLPRGSDVTIWPKLLQRRNFNPRSLAGATEINKHKDCNSLISIHAPSRERHNKLFSEAVIELISIHAPSRERPGRWAGRLVQVQFQSTLPRGSDIAMTLSWRLCWHFNPRSLAGATSRLIILLCMRKHFNPRSLAGATSISSVN